MNPGNPSPMMTPPPPPPPAKGGFPWKWVLIGCGTVTFLGVLVCAGLGYVGYSMSKELISTIKALEKNPQIEAQIGAYTVVEGGQSQTQHPDGSVSQAISLKGERGNGTVNLTFKMDGMSFKILKKTFTNEKTGETTPLQ